MSALYLRTVSSKHKSYDGFQWPNEVGATVTAPDWNSEPVCGGGLHGLRWGCGKSSYLSSEPDAVWQVVRAENFIDLDGKYKFESCVIEYLGNRAGAIAYLLENGAEGKPVVFAIVTVGDMQEATTGEFGISTAGDNGTAITGEGGDAIVGKCGVATAGKFGTARAGEYGTATAGFYGISIAGDGGIAIAGKYGIATAGKFGTARAGEYGSATAGFHGTSTVGINGKASAGEGGVIQILWNDEEKIRMIVGYVGETGIEPNTFYKIKDGLFVKTDCKDGIKRPNVT